jgi:hypothetical protein
MTAGRRDHIQKDLDGRGLAGAARSHEREHAALRHRHVQTLQCPKRSVALCQIVCFDDCGHGLALRGSSPQGQE